MLLLKSNIVIVFSKPYSPMYLLPGLFILRLFIVSPACPLLSLALDALIYLKASIFLYILPTSNTEGCSNSKVVLMGTKQGKPGVRGGAKQVKTHNHSSLRTRPMFPPLVPASRTRNKRCHPSPWLPLELGNGLW